MRGYLRIDVANNCNIRCIMCQAYNSLTRADISFLDFDVFARQTSGELKHWQVIQLGNTAEATIHPKFGDYLKYIRSESDAVIHIVTNGKLLGRYAKLINEIGNCTVQVSMDSLKKKTHEYIREGSDYDRVMANLPLLNTDRTKVLLSFTLMKSNIDEYSEMASFCKERGYSMSAFPLIVREENSIIPYNLLEESLWFNLNSLKIWLQEYYGKDYGSVVTGAAPGTTNLGISEFSCNAHNLDFGVDAYGNTTLCFKVSTGSLYQHSLEEMWNCSVANRFRNLVDLDRSPCVECDYRKRCLAPSMAQLDNHFSESICAVLSNDIRQAIGYDRSISDEEACNLFIQEVGMTKFGIFRIEQSGSEFLARRIIIPTHAQKPQATCGKAQLKANSRHELHRLMVGATESIYTVQLLEQYGDYNLVAYLGQFWAFPLVLGILNPTREEDRRKPGVLSAKTLAELKTKCDKQKANFSPVLVGSEGGYNIVEYLQKYWAVPLSLGSVYLNMKEERQRPGIVFAETKEDVIRLIRSSPSAPNERGSSILSGNYLVDRERVSLSKKAKVRVLLFSTALKLIVKQMYNKGTKTNLKDRTWRELLSKGQYFIRYMVRCNNYAIESSRRCLNELAERGTKEVAVYGANDIAEILYDLSFQGTVKIKAIYDDIAIDKFLGFYVMPIGEYRGTPDKLIVGAFVEVEDKIERLKKLGIDEERIVILG